MGIDILDFTFRIEKRFGIKVHRDDYRVMDEWAVARRPTMKPNDCTVGELHDWVVLLCRRQRVTLPHSSWHGVKLELAKTLGKSPTIIRRESLIVRDLGFS